MTTQDEMRDLARGSVISEWKDSPQGHGKRDEVLAWIDAAASALRERDAFHDRAEVAEGKVDELEHAAVRVANQQHAELARVKLESAEHKRHADDLRRQLTDLIDEIGKLPERTP